MSREPRFSHQRFGGYECSTKGDSRFSALNARMPDGRTIEQHYQCDLKAWQPGGTDWRLGKGKPPKDLSVDLWGGYKALWRVWVRNHPHLLEELRAGALEKKGIVSDLFGTTSITQARALAELLNETDQ